MTGDEAKQGDRPAHREGRLHRIEEAVEEHLRAAEVAMEEAAGYGEVTASIKGVEAAVDPDTELGDDQHEEPPSG